jgi:serine/threonine protein kinase
MTSKQPVGTDGAPTRIMPTPSARPAGRLAPGDVFGDFEIQERLGSGEMGIVYRVRRRSLDRTEALKVIAPRYAADADYRARFKREATHAALAQHPHVVTVYDAHEQDGRLYIAMQYVSGEDLRKRIAAGGALPPATAAEITRQVASALDAAHHANLVHRDVKPANILLADGLGTEHAYLTDFGVSRRVTAPNDLTQPGVFVGAPDYASPEQHRGEPVDARTDVYSLGVVVFEMLTGKLPFPRNGPTAAALAHCLEEPPAATTVNPRLAPAFDRVVAKALAKDPQDRYQTALEFGDAVVAASSTAPGAAEAEAQRENTGVDSEAATSILPRPASEDKTRVMPRGADDPVVGPELRPGPPPPSPARPGSPAPRSAQPGDRHGPASAAGAPPAAARQPARASRRRSSWKYRVGFIVVALLAVAAVAAAAVLITRAKNGGTAAVVASDTNIRSSPQVPVGSPDGNVVGTFGASQHVTVSCWISGPGSPSGWVRLKSPDGGRYVSAGLLTPVVKSPVC